jgi:hypothetical protein
MARVAQDDGRSQSPGGCAAKENALIKGSTRF